MYELLFCPILHIIHEEHHIDAPLAGLYQFEQGGVSCRRRIDGVGGHPKVLLTAIDHLPHLLEEDVTLDDKLCKREANDGFELPP
jgi:hypothetical protein